MYYVLVNCRSSKWCTVVFLLGLTFGVGDALAGIGSIFPNLPSAIPNSTHMECSRHSALFLNNLRNMTSWAYRMRDASAHAELGIIEGSSYQLGNFDECFDPEIPFETQYCLTTIHLDVSKVSRRCNNRATECHSVYDELRPRKDVFRRPRDHVRWAICAPASCGRDELKELIQKALNGYNSTSPLNYKVEITEEDCQYNTKEPWSLEEMSFVGFLVFLALMVTACSVIHSKGYSSKLIRLFSAHETWNDLNRVDNNRALSVLNGVRILLCAGIVLGHSINYVWIGPVLNQREVEGEERKLINLFFLRGDCTVDFYLLIGGLLAAYSQMSREQNYLKSVVSRYMRMAPMFILTTFYYATVYHRMGNGPLWKEIVKREEAYCKTNWWANVLFVNNYVNIDNLCMLQGYYIPLDFHLYLISLPLCSLLRKRPRWGYVATIACCIFCISCSFVTAMQHQVKPFYLSVNNYFAFIRQDDNLKYLYVPTHARGSAYFIGMLFGVNYYNLKKVDHMRVPIGKSLFAISLITVAFCVCQLSSAMFFDPHAAYTVWHAIYGAVHRPFYAFLAGSGVLLLSYTKIPFTRSLFNWKPWGGMGKVTFGIFLFHMSLQMSTTASYRTPQQVTLMFWLSKVMSEFIWCLIASFFFFLLIEGPFGRVPKLFWPESKSQFQKSALPTTIPKIQTNGESTTKM